VASPRGAARSLGAGLYVDVAMVNDDTGVMRNGRRRRHRARRLTVPTRGARSRKTLWAAAVRAVDAGALLTHALVVAVLATATTLSPPTRHGADVGAIRIY